MTDPKNYTPNTDLSDLLYQISVLQKELGQSRADLRFWADGWRHPDQLDEDDLERLLERLCIWWADGHNQASREGQATVDPLGRMLDTIAAARPTAAPTGEPPPASKVA